MRKHYMAAANRVRRAADKTLQTSLSVQLVCLLALTLSITVFGTAIALLVTDFATWQEAFWWTWLRVTDPGYLGTDAGLGRRLLSTGVIVAGLMIFGMLISIITNVIHQKLIAIRAGRNPVYVSQHTLVLGWNNSVFSIIEQLLCDDEGFGGDIAVLADRDVSEMTDEARRYCRNFRSRRVLFRQGSISAVQDLVRMRLLDCRQVIIVGYDDHEDPPPPGEADNDLWLDEVRDSHVVKSLLACYQAFQNAEAEPRREKVPVVVAVNSSTTANVMSDGIPAGLGERMCLRVVDTSDLLARMMAQTAVFPELQAVFDDLFSYEADDDPGEQGAEIYCIDVSDRQAGLTLDECLDAFPRALPIGYLASGQTVVNPPHGTEGADYRLRIGDRLIVVANNADDDEWNPASNAADPGPPPEPVPPPPKRVMILGRGAKTRQLLRLLPDFLPGGSVVLTTEDTSAIPAGRIRFQRVGGDEAALTDTCSFSLRDAVLQTPAEQIVKPDTIVVFNDDANPDHHDAQILMTLMTLCAKANRQEDLPEIVVELMDARSLELAIGMGAGAAIVSPTLVSNLLVQLAFEPDRGDVIGDLLDKAGSELRMRDVANYFRPDESHLSFRQVARRARARDELAIGYQPNAAAPRLNPQGEDRDRPMTRDEFGRIVALTEDV